MTGRVLPNWNKIQDFITSAYDGSCPHRRGVGGLSTSLEKVLSQFSMKGKSVEPSFQSQV